MAHVSSSFSDQSTVPQVLTGTIIPLVLASLCVFGRLYSRAILTSNWGIDDTLIAISWVGAATLSILNCLCVRFGMGHHQFFQNPAEAKTTAWLSYVLRLIYQLVLGTTKLGICTFYLRVFDDRRSKIWVYFIIGFIGLFTVLLEIYVAVRCEPTSSDGAGNLTCDHNEPDIYIFAGCSIFSDALLIIFVVPRILPLKMALRQKVTSLVVVCLSLLVIVAAVVRIIEVTRFNTSSDRTWTSSSITTWSALKIDTGLFCASAPTLKPLILRLSKHVLSSNSDATTSNRYRNGHDRSCRTARSFLSRRKQLEYGYGLHSQNFLQFPTPVLNDRNAIRCTYDEIDEMQVDRGGSESPSLGTHLADVRIVGIVGIVGFGVRRQDVNNQNK